VGTTGWGATTYRLHPLAGGTKQTLLVGFPHFSRYSVCTSTQCVDHLEEPIQRIAERLLAFSEWLPS
jgi:hypothetical protein